MRGWKARGTSARSCCGWRARPRSGLVRSGAVWSGAVWSGAKDGAEFVCAEIGVIDPQRAQRAVARRVQQAHQVAKAVGGELPRMDVQIAARAGLPFGDGGDDLTRPAMGRGGAVVARPRKAK